MSGPLYTYEKDNTLVAFSCKCKIRRYNKLRSQTGAVLRRAMAGPRPRQVFRP
ncbi:hypothetical protein Hanom_Chr05g00469311 [Helianthus anomalus]